MMEHPENSEEYKGLQVNAGVEQVSIVNPYRKKNARRRELSVNDYVEGILKGDVTILSRAVTLVESVLPDHQAVAQEVIEKCLPHAGNSVRIGISGVPGAGKSTSIDEFGIHVLKEKGGNKTVLGGIPDSLPSIVKAYRIQDKVANVGFDWEKREDVWAKVKEEIAEFEADPSEAELGDILFALINAARLYKLRPDNALEQTNLKFMRRFNYVEQKAREQGRALQDMSLEEMDELWNEAKKTEK